MMNKFLYFFKLIIIIPKDSSYLAAREYMMNKFLYFFKLIIIIPKDSSYFLQRRKNDTIF